MLFIDTRGNNIATTTSICGVNIRESEYFDVMTMKIHFRTVQEIFHFT